MPRKKRLWIKYDDSPERLPVCVAESSAELARRTGDNWGNIRSAAHKAHTGKIKNGRYAYVEVEDDN